MILGLLLTLAPWAGASFAPSQEAQQAPQAAIPDIVAIRARRAETISQGAIEYVVILIENGKIGAIGPDLPIERGIPILDLPEHWVVMPGLVNAYSRIGLDGDGFSGSRPDVSAASELFPGAEDYADLLKAGVTTLGVYPAGNDIPGRAVTIRPKGASASEMTVRDNSYLKIVLRANSGSKKYIADGFKKVDEHLEKEKKNREKWEAEQEKKKKSSSKSDKDKEKEKEEEKKEGDDKGGMLAQDEKKSEDKKSEEGSDVYKPLEIDPKVKAFLDLREGELRALISISNAGEYLHLLDAIGEEKFEWDLRVPLTRDSNIFNIKDKVGERGCRVVFEPSITLHPGTLRQRNLPAEFAAVGAKLVFVPRMDNVFSVKSWLRDVGEIVAAGLDRQVALRALTQEAADLLGVGERIGSLAAGKDANLLFLSGDPFDTGTKIEAVILEGEIVYGEVNP